MSEVRTMDTNQLRGFMATHAEGRYVLVDVRQPGEYRQGHIPGARLLPLPELLEDTPRLDPDLPHVFYCRSGSRSARAARHVLEHKLVRNEIHNLQGGFMQWNGLTVDGVPNVRVFAKAASLRGSLLTAMNLEKGAQLLYESIRDAAVNKPLCDLMQKLAPMETEHAQVLYKQLLALPETDRALPNFDELYASMPGDILEGGKSVPDLAPLIAKARQGRCVELAELALEMEISAFDLYRSLAEQSAEHGPEHTPDTDALQTYLWLAEQEKAHERILLKHMDAFI